VVGFLMEHAPLKPWQRGVMEIVREEAYYFAPQAQTKIMNEGWATYWHSRIMTEKALDASEIVDYADHASMVTATHGVQLNPYKLGVELLRHIKERWDKGRHGKEWEECDDMAARDAWDRRNGEGSRKLFEVRLAHNDVTFIDEFLTIDFVRDQKLYAFGYNPHHRQYEIESRQFSDVKQKLLAQISNLGHPSIAVIDANAGNRGELLLNHDHHGVDLDPGYTSAVLANLHAIWKRPVAIRTRAGEKALLAQFDGTTLQETELAE